MARLAMRGYESLDHLGNFLGEQGPAGSTTISTWSNPGGAATYPSGYLGLGSAFWPSGGWNATWDASLNFGTMVAGRTYFFRAMVLVNSSAAASVSDACFSVHDSALTWNGSCCIRVASGAQLSFTYASGAAAGASWSGSGPTLNAGEWHRIELAVTFTGATLNTNSYVVKCDGTTVYSGSDMYLGTAPDRMTAGRNRTGSSLNTNGSWHTFDDLAVNDSTGAAQTSYPGDGKVWVLKPTADSARGTNWFAGAATTTNLFNAVDNTPPVGVVSGSASASTQIENAAKDTTGLYDATMQSYTAAGVPSDHTVAVVNAMGVSGSSAASALVRGVQLVSNPAIAESTNSTPAAIAGTHPSNWTWTGTAYTYAPAVTLGTAPVARVRKGTSATTILMFEALYLLVETTPPLVVTPRPIRNVGQAIKRSTSWMKRNSGIVVPRLWTPADPVPA